MPRKKKELTPTTDTTPQAPAKPRAVKRYVFRVNFGNLVPEGTPVISLNAVGKRDAKSFATVLLANGVLFTVEETAVKAVTFS